MSAFRVGQGVRVLPNDGVIPAGRTAVIVAKRTTWAELRLDEPVNGSRDGFGAIYEVLAPLTDPGADALIAEMRQFSERANKEAERLSKIAIKEAKV